MPYILRYKYDRNQPQKVRGLPFATIPLATLAGAPYLKLGPVGTSKSSMTKVM
jgi:hypothetical protein